MANTPDTEAQPQGEGGPTYGDTTADETARRSKFRKPETEADPSEPLSGDGEASPITERQNASGPPA